MPRQQQQQQQQQQRFYGDLVNGICYALFLPFYTWLWWVEAANIQKTSETIATVVASSGGEDEENNYYYYYCHQQQNLDELSSDTAEQVCVAPLSSSSLSTTTAHVALNVLVGPRNIVLTFLWTVVCCWWSYYQSSSSSTSFPNSNVIASTLALLGMSASIAGMNLYQWPHVNEVIVIPQFLWSLLIISCNFSLPFWCKTMHAIIALFTAILVAVQTPLLDAAQEELPLLLGTTSVHVLFHYYCSTYSKRHNDGSSSRQLVSAQMASLVLAGTFAYHTAVEISAMYSSPHYAKQGGYAILKAGFFATIGLAASGAFRREINVKESLQVLVEQRARQLTKQSERLRVVGMALEASETAIAVTDAQSRIHWSNPALERLIGKSTSADLYLCSLMDTLEIESSSPPVTATAAEEGSSSRKQQQQQQQPGYLLRCFRENCAMNERITIKDKHFQMEVSPCESSSSSSSLAVAEDGPSYLVVLKDITAQLAREQAEKAAERQEVLTQAMTESMQTLSHELRTPLQGIMGVISLLLNDDNLSKSVHESLTMAMTSASLLLTLINNTLDVRKCEANMLDAFELTPICLSESLNNAADFCQPFATVAEIKLVIDMESARNLHICSNALRFQQVMINLISNAVKYTERGTEVNVFVKVMTIVEAKSLMNQALAGAGVEQHEVLPEHHDEMKVAVICVSDEGHGVPESERDRIFGKFHQLCNATTIKKEKSPGQQFSGTGLGLNLCKMFVLRMHGGIWVNNNSDRGACFSFHLPIAHVEETPILLSESNASAATTTATERSIHDALISPSSIDQAASNESSSSASKYKVLVVDDILINLKVLERMLKRLQVKKVKTAISARKALEELSMDTYDLVLTDIQMPEMSGIELSDRIHDNIDNNRFQRIPTVVGLTADVSEAVRDACIESGMDMVLLKPLTFEQVDEFFNHTVPRIFHDRRHQAATLENGY